MPTGREGGLAAAADVAVRQGILMADRVHLQGRYPGCKTLDCIQDQGGCDTNAKGKRKRKKKCPEFRRKKKEARENPWSRKFHRN